MRGQDIPKVEYFTIYTTLRATEALTSCLPANSIKRGEKEMIPKLQKEFRKHRNFKNTMERKKKGCRFSKKYPQLLLCLLIKKKYLLRTKKTPRLLTMKRICLIVADIPLILQDSGDANNEDVHRLGRSREGDDAEKRDACLKGKTGDKHNSKGKEEEEEEGRGE
ncbi:hypothetical protein M9H77_12178 [Catharanthus roseus]|uniref:Uncharacterized protein n=1 Tax=Catharanthus roseus TaxID=4058 RepID=A0ACC0BGS0_CATRO|nr:hypothetical protein M9H77_12178 [Catharanthus roseus]